MFAGTVNIYATPTTNGQAALLKHADNLIRNNDPHCRDLAVANGLDYDVVRWTAMFQRLVANSHRTLPAFANVDPV